jgi:hypothetical protein
LAAANAVIGRWERSWASIIRRNANGSPVMPSMVWRVWQGSSVNMMLRSSDRFCNECGMMDYPADRRQRFSTFAVSVAFRIGRGAMNATGSKAWSRGEEEGRARCPNRLLSPNRRMLHGMMHPRVVKSSWQLACMDLAGIHDRFGGQPPRHPNINCAPAAGIPDALFGKQVLKFLGEMHSCSAYSALYRAEFAAAVLCGFFVGNAEAGLH